VSKALSFTTYTSLKNIWIDLWNTPSGLFLRGKVGFQPNQTFSWKLAQNFTNNAEANEMIL